MTAGQCRNEVKVIESGENEEQGKEGELKQGHPAIGSAKQARITSCQYPALEGRGDVLGNLAVLLAALGVLGTGTGWPDLMVASIMATLALQGARVVLNQSRTELRLALSFSLKRQDA
jgi:Co/Zn/Cd efflux system component